MADLSWKVVGEWLKSNAGTGAALVGSLLTGNVPGAVAAGVALVSSATGEADADKVLASLQTDPSTMLRLRELASQDEASIREHIRVMHESDLRDKQHEHEQQQLTIRGGDQAEDEYVRHTRPKMARQSWAVTAGYIVAFEGARVSGLFEAGASGELALLMMAPAAAYLGFRSLDKFKARDK